MSYQIMQTRLLRPPPASVDEEDRRLRRRLDQLLFYAEEYNRRGRRPPKELRDAVISLIPVSFGEWRPALAGLGEGQWAQHATYEQRRRSAQAMVDQLLEMLEAVQGRRAQRYWERVGQRAPEERRRYEMGDSDGAGGDAYPRDLDQVGDAPARGEGDASGAGPNRGEVPALVRPPVHFVLRRTPSPSEEDEFACGVPEHEVEAATDIRDLVTCAGCLIAMYGRRGNGDL